ncbi:polyphosphate kinase 2 [Ampullimonas aquatilis]|uniref:polyphosphate kinase 2 n=1 Tax=Ampullimonas aquatilis TaxID=1341549 RepID=UPI003C771241
MSTKNKTNTKTDAPQDGDKAIRKARKEDYKKTLLALQIELVKLQKHLISGNMKVLAIFEGRDAAGKDGAIKRITEHLSPRETRVVALGKPSDRDCQSWYFQRYTPYLPAAQEMVLFNRSWYNRAGVEKVMGFCTEAEYASFIDSVLDYERLLVRSGITLFKFYLDISEAEQKKRLKERAESPLTQWKISPIDAQAQKYWKQYSKARDTMLTQTHDPATPWTIVHANDKKLARINIIRHMLSHLDYKDKDATLVQPDSNIVQMCDPTMIGKDWLAP